MAEEATSPVGFLPGTKARAASPPPAASPQAATSPAEGPQQSPPPASRPAAQPPGADGEERQPHRDPGGLRQRLESLREQAAGSRRPLGSPEGPGHLPRPNPTRSSSGSSNARRVTDTTALIVRQGSIWLDWLLGKRFPDNDFVATAEESYNIASPLAGELLDRIPESGPLADVAERAGLIGAIVSTVTYGARALFGKPGGRAESEALQERFVRRLGHTKEARQAAAETAATEEAAAPAPATPSYAQMVGLDDMSTDLGIPQ